MYPKLDRRLFVIVLLPLLGLSILFGASDGAVRAQPSSDLDWSKLDSVEAETVELVFPEDPEWSAQSSVSDSPDSPAAPVLITDEDFEDTEFPPPGWTLLDEPARLDGVDPRFTFSREICNTMTIVGGMAAAWAVGGGTMGEQLPCWTPYTSGTDIWSHMLYTVDTRIYAAGLQLSTAMNMIVPEGAPADAFQVCATTGRDEDPFACFNISTNAPGRWGTLGPLIFPDAANQENAIIFLRYRDDGGALQTEGLLVDNLKIWGLPEPIEPTTPPPPSATPTSVGPTPTFTPSPSPTRDFSSHVFMPIAVKGFDMDDVPPAATVSPTGVEVAFGTEVDAATGEITGQGSAFQYGIMQICGRIRWWGQAPQTRLRWQWYYGQQAIEQLKGDINVPEAEGFEFQCMQGPLDEQARPLPVPRGWYDIEAFIGDDEDPTVVGKARIHDDVPPGKTPLP